METNHSIPQQLKDYRKELGFTQEQLAEKIGIKRATYANYEYDGRAKVPLYVYLKIQELLYPEKPGGIGDP